MPKHLHVAYLKTILIMQSVVASLGENLTSLMSFTKEDWRPYTSIHMSLEALKKGEA